MNTYRIHQDVMTPNGRGIFQGRLLEKTPTTGTEVATRILVSHSPSNILPEVRINVLAKNGYHNGPWVLCAYAPEDVTPC